MDDKFIKDLDDPSLNENLSLINQASERSERLNSLLIDELRARDIVNQESQKRIDQFLQNAQSEVNFDPSYIEFFAESQKRIDCLMSRYQRLQNGEAPQEEEIAELEQRTDAATSFFSGINEALSINLSKIESQTNSYKKQIPYLISTYETELLIKRDLTKKLEEITKQKLK